MDEAERRAIIERDAQLTPEQLDDQYNPDGDGEHPVFTRADWREEVAGHLTLRGYWDWVSSWLESENA